jgi:hypothetical protein
LNVISANETIPSTMERGGLDGRFKIVDSNGQALAHVYAHADPRDAGIAKALTLDEARRIASKHRQAPALARQGLGARLRPS